MTILYRLSLVFLMTFYCMPSKAVSNQKPQPLSSPPAPAVQLIDIAYIGQTQLPPNEMLSNLDPFIPHQGAEGAALGINDNNTTGVFTHQKFVLHPYIVSADDNPVTFFKQHILPTYHFVVTNLNVADTIAVADMAATEAIQLLDAGTVDDTLRNAQCRENTLHIRPSRAMKADALAQYMMKKRWTKWFLVVGKSPDDTLFANALKRSAKRFGIKIVQEKTWTYTFDDRHTAQSDIAVFSQSDDYDVLVVADEQGLFGEYLPYRTWLARPVIGTQGLVATAWHRTHELWGASQIQHRFYELAKRDMQEQDYSTYLAIRALGEAATRTRSNHYQTLHDYLLSPAFALQGYKGNALSFRPWDGQLRQPILLASARSAVAVAPIEGFLHPKTELDTLGFDQRESLCAYPSTKPTNGTTPTQ
jgi:ABC transporter substrate binding protein (PQQ-dependent alcohol dehydrogenase system)